MHFNSKYPNICSEEENCVSYADDDAADELGPAEIIIITIIITILSTSLNTYVTLPTYLSKWIERQIERYIDK